MKQHWLICFMFLWVTTGLLMYGAHQSVSAAVSSSSQAREDDLFTNYTFADLTGKGYAVFGADACMAEWGQDWAGTGVAMQVQIPSGFSWSISSIKVSVFDSLWVTGTAPSTESMVTLSLYADKANLPDVTQPIIHTTFAVRDFGEHTIPMSRVSVQGKVWIALLPMTPDSRVGFATTAAKSGKAAMAMAKSMSMGASWQAVTGDLVENCAMTIKGTAIHQTTDALFQNYTSFHELPGVGWPLFGQETCQTLLEQPFPGTAVAIPITIPNGTTWRIEQITTALFNRAWVDGTMAEPQVVELVLYGHGTVGELPDPSNIIARYPTTIANPIGDLSVAIEPVDMTGSFWIGLRAMMPNTCAAWAQSTATGTVAKSITMGATWGDMGSPFIASQPAIRVLGTSSTQPQDVLYETYNLTQDLPGSGWPIFGSQVCQELYGYDWQGTIPAMQINVPNGFAWRVTNLTMVLFNSNWVTGEAVPPEPVEFRFYRPNADGLPDPHAQYYSFIGVANEFQEYSIPLSGISMSGNYWLAMVPTSPTTRAAVAQGTSSGAVAKSITAGATWNEMGSPFMATLPALKVHGTAVAQPADVLFQNYVTFDELPGNGWGVFGSTPCQQQWGQDWPGTALAVRVDIPAGVFWKPTMLTVPAFNETWVTGLPAEAARAILMVCGDNAGVPDTKNVMIRKPVSYNGFTENAVDITGAVLAGKVWVVMMPLASTTKMAWAQSGQTGAVAKSISAGSTWREMGSPMTAAQPAVRIQGQAGTHPTNILYQNYLEPTELPGNGWPVMGSEVCKALFTQTWPGAATAVKIEVPPLMSWRLETINFAAFNESWVTPGAGVTEYPVIKLYGDLDGVPNPNVTYATLRTEVNEFGEFTVPANNVSMPKTFWVAMLPSTGNTKMAWAQSNQAGSVAKSISAGASWRDMGSPFMAQLPAVQITGTAVSHPVNVLYQNYSSLAELPGNGYVLFGQMKCAELLGQPSWAGTCVAFKIDVPSGKTWAPQQLRIAGFNKSWVTGETAPEETVRIALYNDAGGLPGAMMNARAAAVNSFGEYMVDMTGLELRNSFWVALSPTSPASQLAWAQSNRAGAVAKSTNLAGSWMAVASARTVMEPAFMLIGGETITPSAVPAVSPLGIFFMLVSFTVLFVLGCKHRIHRDHH